eukprot:COSAG02_NODE_15429_length_1172_cov_1.109972_1_plen_62_part_01
MHEKVSLEKPLKPYVVDEIPRTCVIGSTSTCSHQTISVLRSASLLEAVRYEQVHVLRKLFRL